VKSITIDGRTYSWREILAARREQKKAARKTQLALFELKQDSRPANERTAADRLSQPSLLEWGR
jgi:hypothetical protein